MEIKYQINSRMLILILVGAIMSSTSYLMFVYDPVQLIIRKVSTLAPGTLFLKLWSAPPYEVLIDVYIFNVTNPEEFLRGEKLQVEQVGPYVYQELLMNNNATFNENGTMTFLPRRYLSFRRDRSIGDPLEDRIISPNIPLVGIATAVSPAAQWGLSVAAAMTGAQSFLNLTIDEYLWGYEDKLVSTANTFLSSWINFEKFGILDRLMALDNASNVVTLNMHPEYGLASPLLNENERSSLYHIHRWNGSPGLKHWGYVDTENNETVEGNTRCNMVEGAFEGTIFPPHVKENATVKLYRRAFCRPVPFTYSNKSLTRDGFEAYTFELDKLFLATPEENPENACYCVKGKCLPKGLNSLAPCYYDIPIAISQPHFLNADPVLMKNVVGMKPNASAHGSSFKIHPVLGIPLEADLRIQINLDVGSISWVSKAQPFNNMVLPLFWLQLSMGETPPLVYTLITLGFNVFPVIQKILIYLLGLGGLALMSGSALFTLFFAREESNGRLSFRGDYRPIPIIPINSPYFKPEIRILK